MSAEDWLLGGAFALVVAVVIGRWWRRNPRRAWVLTTEGGWFLGGYLSSFYFLDRIAADRPIWVGLLGIAAVAALWMGVFLPVMLRRGERRLGVQEQPKPPDGPEART